MHNRHQDKELYFREQVYTTENHVIPFIEKYLKVREGIRVLEVGCGEGGNMKPFLERGCQVTGVDISVSKIEHARNFIGKDYNHNQLILLADDIYNLEANFAASFDLIILRDVIEHIHDQNKFMGFIKRFLKPSGMIFFGFPPWYNPFGGHQQICQNRILSKLPFFHLLPGGIYRFILKAGGEPDDRIGALQEIKETGISIGRFKRILSRNQYRTIAEVLYLINPNYEIKFKLKPVRQPKWLRFIPGARSLLVTAAYYLVRPNGNQ